MAKLLIVFHSQSGANQQLAQAAYQAAATVEAVQLACLAADETSSDDLCSADTVLFCFAEMNGAISGGMKAMLDRVFYPLIDQNKVLSVAAAMSVGNDGSSALQSFQRIMTGLHAKWLSEPLIVKREPNQQDLDAVAELAMAMAEGAVMGIF